TISAMWRILAMASVLLLTLWAQLAREYSLLQGADNNSPDSIRAADGRLIAHEHALDVLPGRAEQERRGLPGDASDVRGQEELLGRRAVEPERRVVARWWLGGIDMAGRPAEPARLEVPGERRLVDHSATRDLDQDRIGFHRGELASADQSCG